MRAKGKDHKTKSSKASTINGECVKSKSFITSL